MLNKISKESDLGHLGGVFCLQAHVELQLFQVRPIEDVYVDGLTDFSAGITNTFSVLAISPSQDELWRFKTELIDEKKQEFSGNLIRGDKPILVAGEARINDIQRMSINKFCDNNLALFKLGFSGNWDLLSILKNSRSAATNIDMIRSYIRKADPPKP